ncbi:NAD(P)-dependent oxidoreductase [Streptomyces radicis]|uniref:NAD(P)-dependent oxidoreductase n=1 Tax=Streptomyces radicis TaxID=1750517 RepID=A0A3A9VTP2_9ACTN|nr:NAD(P)-dependent oxidoreductase [Streptomyces radicis]RKN14863.1 NAD(P)-dependent oxidoreductase [Streptomyces radicis]
MSTREPVTVIGLDAMGAKMAEILVDAGHPTTVWNRTASKADRLVERGATLAASPTEALRASGLAVVSLVDHGAMHDAIGAADPAAPRDPVLVALSSDTPEQLRGAARWAAGHGVRFVAGTYPGDGHLPRRGEQPRDAGRRRRARRRDDARGGRRDRPVRRGAPPLRQGRGRGPRGGERGQCVRDPAHPGLQ